MKHKFSYFSHILIIFGLLLNCSSAQAQSAKRILFIGSEYLNGNNIPELVEKIAGGRNEALMAGQSTQSGFRLMQHFQLDKTMLLLQRQQWDYVVLQEHGRLPLDKTMRERSMIPAVVRFAKVSRNKGAKPILMQTWGWLRGVPNTEFMDFGSMHKELSKSYRAASKVADVPIAPVGEAFKRALRNDQGIVLLYSDGRTPTLAGSYLAACVIYATMFQKSPFGSTYFAGLKPHQAKFLQDLAGEVVLKKRREWNLPKRTSKK